MNKDQNRSSTSQMFGVQELIDKLQTDGVQRGLEEGQQQLAAARREAFSLLEQAKCEADQLVVQARGEAARILEQGREALRLAHRDAVLELHDSLRQQLAGKVRAMCEEVFADRDFLRALILEVAGKISQEKKSAETVIVFPAQADGHDRSMQGDESTSLKRFLGGITGEMMREGVTFSLSDRVAEGIRMQLVDQDVEVDLNPETVSKLLMQFLAPRFRASLEP